jgi:hypothetical protein
MSRHKRREYDIYSRKDGWKIVSYSEWATWVIAGKRACIVQIAGAFGAYEIGKTFGYHGFVRRDLRLGGSIPCIRNCKSVRVYTGPSNRKNRAAGEWESRVFDDEEIDLANPSYCQGSIEEIEAMHAKALSSARQFLRNYVERPIPYWQNILDGTDLRYLAKTPDFAVDYFEEERDGREEDV